MSDAFEIKEASGDEILTLTAAPNRTAEFFNEKQESVCKMDWSSGEMIVTGDYEQGARIFFDYLKDYLQDELLPREE